MQVIEDRLSFELKIHCMFYSFYGPTKIKIPKTDLKTRDQSGSEN